MQYTFFGWAMHYPLRALWIFLSLAGQCFGKIKVQGGMNFAAECRFRI